MSGSPPRGGTAGATRVNTIVTKVDMSTAADNLGQVAWNGQLPRMADVRDPTSSSSVESKLVTICLTFKFFELILPKYLFSNYINGNILFI